MKTDQQSFASEAGNVFRTVIPLFFDKSFDNSFGSEIEIKRNHKFNCIRTDV